ncbi:MAG: hypothetical protein NTW87_16065 [Planctomycetota bacterium]|nr:hypothetical protein [Planctomycetota bacterium]
MKAGETIRCGTRCLAMLCAALLAQHEVSAASPSEAGDEALVIGPRRESKAPAPAGGGREWFKAGLSAEAYQAEAAAAAAALGGDKLSAEEKTALSEAIRREGERTGRAFGACLDWKQYNATTRLGAIRGLTIGAPAARTAAKGLAGSAIGEPVQQVRSTAISLIRDRKDAAVTAEILRFWRSAYDDELGFDEAKRVAAVAAMRDIGDRRAYEALLYLVTLELHTGAASSAGPMGEVSITGNGINLPIQLPSIETMSFNGTIIVPALASLKGVTGQDFGRDANKWREWIKQQPDFRK